MAGKRNQGSRKENQIKEKEKDKSILVLGIGNPILTDDAVGILVVRELHNIDADVEEAAIGGMSLLDLILGYDTVIIVDAVKSPSKEKGRKSNEKGKGKKMPGTVSILQEHEIKRALHASSTHDVSFSEALELGRNLFPDEMPSTIIVIGIEVQDTETFSEIPTEPVRNAIPEAARMITELAETLRSHP
ncbi:MAG: hydrogenase maturation protease [Theionarchaea archaeon]|nr:MAG: hypothetical protein AYK18_11475 [Theionarchaea archaeon DG-70]MBU7010302.1 hydrogenase maturation protease [Theionarchaea archaeon]